MEQIVPVVVVPPPGRPTFEPVFEPARLRRMLAPVIGLPCDPHEAAERIARPYRFLGYVPSVEASCEGHTLRVRVRESSHTLDLITFDPAELERIGAGPGSGPAGGLYPVPEDAPRGLLLGLIGTRPGDLYNHARYRADRDFLVRFGYTIAFVGGAASGDGWHQGAYLVQSLTPRSRLEGGDAREQNYIGGTAGYGPTYGGSAGVIYQREGLFGTLDTLTIAPSYNTSLGGNLTYRAPLLARRETPANLYDLQV
ncbi:MAG TPA: hypothetical protein VFV36_06060, partial [Candidatus Methylomirabilis sp.]|nr:hypothetical protein [Candidatus Methylomirabilis sp.]